MIAALKNTIHRVAPDLQFWGYEGGNILAAIAGSGGLVALYSGLQSIAGMPTHNAASGIAAAFTRFPDIIVTTGLAVIVLATIGFSHLFSSDETVSARIWLDRAASIAGIVLVAAALFFGASWITFAAVSFVSASALLRLCRISPVFLKLGGLLLAAGGFGLAGYGLTSEGLWQMDILPVLTALTGLYVIFASMMTYQGGIYECSADRSNRPRNPVIPSAFDPDGWIGRLLETHLDRPMAFIVRSIALPAVFWVPSKTKESAPFLTSMWARLPWRLLTATAAIMTGTQAGFIFGLANAFWAVGDIAIGSFDWKRSHIEDDAHPQNDPAAEDQPHLTETVKPVGD